MNARNVALVKQANPSLNLDSAIYILKNTVRTDSTGANVGKMANAVAAVQAAGGVIF